MIGIIGVCFLINYFFWLTILEVNSLTLIILACICFIIDCWKSNKAIVVANLSIIFFQILGQVI